MESKKRGRTRKVEAQKQESPYQVLLEYGNEQYTGKGESLLDALMTMERPKKVWRGGVMVMRHGEKKVAKIISVNQLRILFLRPFGIMQFAKLHKSI